MFSEYFEPINIFYINRHVPISDDFIDEFYGANTSKSAFFHHQSFVSLLSQSPTKMMCRMGKPANYLEPGSKLDQVR